MLRKIVNIDEALCDGCGDCVPSCHEGALQIIDGKARLISDLFCDGLGACLGHCPQGAITIDVREAEPYNETKVMETIVKGGPNVIKAHLEHLIDHNEMEYFQQAINFLTENGIDNPVKQNNQRQHNYGSGCPGSRSMSFEVQEKSEVETGIRRSHLRQWPVQLHLVSPHANYFQNSDLLLAADCCAFAYGDFHKDFMNGKSLAIACPKLDSNQEVYFDKLVSMINESNLKSITVLVMQVPCCSGLYQLATEALKESGKDIPLKVVVMGVNGDILKEVQVN
ncbi:MAG: 4Fe-4S ferredoxin [Ignavibacterium sp.]|nr:4Fe-4S ferredoxin [Ignavibacterium sp.]